MNFFTIFLFATSVLSFYGQYQTFDDCSPSVMSRDGNIVVCIDSLMNMRVSENNGSGFTEIQSDSITGTPTKLQLSQNGKILFINLGGSVQMLQNISSAFIDVNNFGINPISGFDLSSSGSTIIFGDDLNQLIYIRSYTSYDYIFNNSLTHPADINYISIDSEGSRIIASYANQVTQIYKYNFVTGTFDYGATIDVNASLNAISEDGVISYIVEDLANGSNAVFGYAYYDWNDIFWEYLPIQLDNVQDVSISSDGLKISVFGSKLGDTNKYINTISYEDTGRSYTFIDSQIVECSSGISRATISSNAQYTLVLGCGKTTIYKQNYIAPTPPQSPPSNNSEEQQTSSGETEFVENLAVANTYINVCRFPSTKMILGILQLFPLYQYHKENYTQFPAMIFRVSNYIQKKKYQLFPVQTFIKNIQESLPQRNQYSDQRFVSQEGKDEGFIKNTVELLIIVIPSFIILFFVFNRLFFLLFNYEISKHLRLFSFVGFFFQMTMEGNVQFLVFLISRNMRNQMFAINFQDKLMMTFVIFFGFFLLVFCVSGYTLYFHFYARLSSYFLDNLYRLHSSFLIVTTIYGVRPLLRGIMHAFLGEYTVIQLFSIAGIDLVTIFLIVIVEFKRKVYISKCGLLCDLIYYISLMLFNLLLVCDLYAKGIRELVEVVEHVMQILLWIIVVVVCLRLIALFVFDKGYFIKKKEESQKEEEEEEEQENKKIEEIKLENEKIKKQKKGKRQMIKVQVITQNNVVHNFDLPSNIFSAPHGI